MKKAALVVSILATLLLGGQTPSPIQQKNFQRDLDALTQRGFTYRLLDNDLIELTDPMSGEKHLKSLREPSEAMNREWAAQRGVPILEIDPNTIDTNKYTGWYNYWTTVPLGNSFGNPLVVGDLNHNGQAEVYGAYKDTLSWDDYQARLYEIDSLGNVLLRYQYIPRPGISRRFSDVDKDSMAEAIWETYGIVSGYEQNSPNSLPVNRTFAHDMYYLNSSSGFTGIYIGNLDDDSLTDFLYQGSEPDPNDTNVAVAKTFIAEFDPGLQNFVRVWSIQFGPQGGAAGFSVADFDGDGKMELVATRGLSGRVYVAENTGDNQYAMTWQDSTGLVNFYYHGSGDVDNDGKIEFFTGATMSNGNWVLMYEADSSNTYSAKLLFHLLSGGVFADPIYKSVDIDGDGKLELAMMVGSDLYVFKSNADNLYFLCYFKRENGMEAIAFYDFNHDGKQDIVASKFGVTPQGNGWLYADIYVASTLVSVKDLTRLPAKIQLLQNYPNPFNPSTTLEYSLPARERITVKVYSLPGQEVATLVDEEQNPGRHTATWNAANCASGIYFARLNAVDASGNLHYSKVAKLVLMK